MNASKYISYTLMAIFLIHFSPVTLHSSEADKNEVEEAVSEQITDDALSGRIEDTVQDYINDLDTEQASYFDYGSNDDVYGDYS